MRFSMFDHDLRSSIIERVHEPGNVGPIDWSTREWLQHRWLESSAFEALLDHDVYVSRTCCCHVEDYFERTGASCWWLGKVERKWSRNNPSSLNAIPMRVYQTAVMFCMCSFTSVRWGLTLGRQQYTQDIYDAIIQELTNHQAVLGSTNLFLTGSDWYESAAAKRHSEEDNVTTPQRLDQWCSNGLFFTALGVKAKSIMFYSLVIWCLFYCDTFPDLLTCHCCLLRAVIRFVSFKLH